MNFGKRTLWSDESKFNLFETDGKIMVWRAPKEEFQPACTVPTTKHRDGNAKVWRCFARNRRGDLAFIDDNMTGYMYKDILEKNLFQSAVKLNLGKNIASSFIVTQTILLILSRIGSTNKELNWPPFSPDMKPIEHLWDEVKRRMEKH